MLPQSSSRVVAPVLASKNTGFAPTKKTPPHLFGGLRFGFACACFVDISSRSRGCTSLRHGGCLTGRLLGSTFTGCALRRKVRSSDAFFLRDSLFALPRKSQAVPSFLLLLSRWPCGLLFSLLLLLLLLLLCCFMQLNGT